MLGSISLIVWVAGCDKAGPSAPGSRGVVEPPSQTTTVAVILPASGPVELEVWEQAARRQEATERALVEISRLKPGEPAAKQVDLIKEAVAKGNSAIVILAEDPAAVAPALVDARSAGVAVVLLDRAVPVEGKPFPLVQYEPERESARKLAAAAVEDAKATGFPPGGPALLLINGPADDHAKARQKAMREALEAAGVKVLSDVIFAGMSEQGESALKAGFLMHPPIAMVICDEDQGISGALRVRHALDHSKKRFVLSGYSADRSVVDLARKNVLNGVVDRNINEPMVKAFQVALAMVRGETVADRVEIPTPFVRSTGLPDDKMITDFLGTPVRSNVTAPGGPESKAPE